MARRSGMASYVNEYKKDNGVMFKVMSANALYAAERKQRLLNKIRLAERNRRPKKWYEVMWDYVLELIRRA